MNDSGSVRIWILDVITTQREKSQARQTRTLILHLSVTKMSCSPLALTKLTHQCLMHYFGTLIHSLTNHKQETRVQISYFFNKCFKGSWSQ